MNGLYSGPVQHLLHLPDPTSVDRTVGHEFIFHLSSALFPGIQPRNNQQTSIIMWKCR